MGLTMEYCVLDTALNGADAGFESYHVIDCTRAVHFKFSLFLVRFGIYFCFVQVYNDGFSFDAQEVAGKMKKHKAKFCMSNQLQF